VTNEQKVRRKRGAWLGLLLLLLALGGAGYALSSSPSASTGPGKPSASPSGQVLAPAASGNGNGGNGNGGNDNCVEPSNGNGNCAKTFGVTVGQTPTLYPSVARTLPVTFTNPNSFDISITTFHVSVSVPPSQSTACPASSLQVPTGTITPSPALTAPRNASIGTSVSVKLPANAPEGCQGVTFTVTVSASAVKK
jgi:hypothetical protein